jgi:cobalt-precorrin-6B (C15)-methyltransferase
LRWIRDEEFIRGEIPMTKFETRTLIIGTLAIEPGDRLIDIGAGTGSISVEAALQGAKVYAVERELEGVNLIRRNSEKFGAEVEVIAGTAPESLEAIPLFNKAFVGGSGKKLREIVAWVFENMEPGGVIAGSFITLSNLVEFQQSLKQHGFADIETKMISTARAEGKAELLKAQNPIFIVRGTKR